MRRAPDKKHGYIILPFAINLPADLPEGIDSQEYLENIAANKEAFRVVFQVLNALKSIDPDNRFVWTDPNGKEHLSDAIEVVYVQNNEIVPKAQVTESGNKKGQKHKGSVGVSGKNNNASGGEDSSDKGKQGYLLQEDDSVLLIEQAVKVSIMKRFRNKREWEDWAEDVGKICSDQVAHIRQLLLPPHDVSTSLSVAQASTESSAGKLVVAQQQELQTAFNNFKSAMGDTFGKGFSDDDLIEMLAQHIVIKPVLDQLFIGYPFTEKNPIASALTTMVDHLNANGLKTTTVDLEEFYAGVARRMSQVTNQKKEKYESLKERQNIIVELFDRFFNRD